MGSSRVTSPPVLWAATVLSASDVDDAALCVSHIEPEDTAEKAGGTGSGSARTNSGGGTAAAGITWCGRTEQGTSSYFQCTIAVLYSLMFLYC